MEDHLKYEEIDKKDFNFCKNFLKSKKYQGFTQLSNISHSKRMKKKNNDAFLKLNFKKDVNVIKNIWYLV